MTSRIRARTLGALLAPAWILVLGSACRPALGAEPEKSVPITPAAARAEAGDFEVRVARACPEWPVPGGPLLLVLETTGGQSGVHYRCRSQPSDAWFDSPDPAIQWKPLAEGQFRIEIQAVDSAGRQSKTLVYERAIRKPAGPQANNVPPDSPKTFVNSIGVYFTLVPSGEFAMGSPSDDDAAQEDELPLHGVRITKPFYLAKVEVTNGQYRALMGKDPGYGQRDGATPRHLDWETANRFCQLLSNLMEERRAGRCYRLPTEAEWEYACRAGTATRFHYGDKLTADQATFNHHGTGYDVHAPNAFGLYDMHGKAAEWCSDWYGKDSYWTSSAADPAGPESGDAHVCRGGSGKSRWHECRSASRLADPKPPRYEYFGFRPVCEIVPPEQRSVAKAPFFDKDLTNWEGLKDAWQADDGAIYGRTDKSTSLVSREKYRDFELSFSARIDAPLGGLRVYFRSDAPDRREFSRVEGPYWTISNSGREDTRGKINYESTGILMGDDGYLSQPSAATRDLLDQSRAKDGFYRCTLRCVGKRVTASIDGVPVVDGDFTIDPLTKHELRGKEGFLAFKISETAVTIKDIQFRDLGGDASGAERPQSPVAQYDLTGTWLAAGQGAKGGDLVFALQQNYQGDVKAAFRGAGTGFNQVEGKISGNTFSGKYRFMYRNGHWETGPMTWTIKDKDHADVFYVEDGKKERLTVERLDPKIPDLGKYGAMEDGSPIRENPPAHSAPPGPGAVPSSSSPSVPHRDPRAALDFSGVWVNAARRYREDVSRLPSGGYYVVDSRDGTTPNLSPNVQEVMNAAVQGDKLVGQFNAGSAGTGYAEWSFEGPDRVRVRVRLPRTPPGRWQDEFTLSRQGR